MSRAQSATLRRKKGTALQQLILGVVLVGISLAVSVGYSDPVGATKHLEEEGYTEIQITGRQYTGCGNNLYRTTFVAKNSRGIKVHGLVCKGVFDASVIKRT